MAEMARQTKAPPSGAQAHHRPVSAEPEAGTVQQPSLLSASAVVGLLRHIGNSGVQRLLDANLQRKKTIDEDVRINGNLSVSGHVFSYDAVYGKQGLLTDHETVTKTLRSDGQADVGGDLYVKGNTHKGSSIPEQ